MLKMEMRRARVEREVLSEIDSAIAALSAQYQPMIQPALAAQAAVLGVDEKLLRPQVQTSRAIAGSRQQLRQAEVLIRGQEMFAIVVHDLASRLRRVSEEGGGTRMERVLEGQQVTVYAVGPNARSSGIAAVQAELEKQLNTELEEFHFESERFEELRNEGRESAALPTEAELHGARVLSDRDMRTLSTAIKSASGLLQSGVYRQLPGLDSTQIDAILSQLEESGLILAEYVVICGRTSTQVMRVPSTSLLESLDAQGVRCTCGRKLSEEGCEAAWSITEAGQNLLDKSAWMTVLLIDELLRIGVPIDDIFVDQQAGGDELDCIALISGDMVLFELKDKPFNLGNAYSFGAKIGIMRPRLSIVITTEHVGGDAREHFERAQRADERRGRYYDPDDEDERELAPRYVEGIENVRDTLESIVTEVTVGDARRVLTPILSQASVSAGSLLAHWPAREVDADTGGSPGQ